MKIETSQLPSESLTNCFFHIIMGKYCFMEILGMFLQI